MRSELCRRPVPQRPRARRAVAAVPAAVPAAVLAALALAGCADPHPAPGSDVRPPVAAPQAPPAPVGVPATAPVPAPPGTVPAATGRGGTPAAAPPAADVESDPVVVALRGYLRAQAHAVNARDGAAPEFRATLTQGAQSWAVPLLRENFGDLMPGPYPVGVQEVSRPTAHRALVRFCQQNRGWQVDRTTGRPVNPPRYGTGHAELWEVDGRWLVADVVDDGGACDPAAVVVERF